MTFTRIVPRAGWLGFLAALFVAASSGLVRAAGEPPDYARVFELAFQPGWSIMIDDALPKQSPRVVKMSFRVFEAGALQLSSGRIKASDPFVGLEHPGFTTDVPKGRFPVRLALVEGTNSHGRVAFARVAFSAAPVMRWEMAVTSNQDVATLKRDEYFGYPVDAGIGCFIDAAAAPAVAKRMKSDEAWALSLLDSQTDRPARPSFHRVVEVKGGNLIMFTSGWGDGLYASWFGYAADGTLAALITDFNVVDWSKAQIAP